MSGAISVDMGRVDIYFSDIAEEVHDHASEHELLEELAERHAASSRSLKSAAEVAEFHRVATGKLHELAKWFEENSP